MIHIFTVIVTYNAMHSNWIDKCLRSLQNSTIPVKTIVVDNGSTDNTCDYVPKTFPNVIWLPQNRNLGFGQANNVGIKYAMENHADYILLLNQDATIYKDAIELMLNNSDGESLLSPLHLNGDGSKLDFMFRNRMRKIQDSFFDDVTITKHIKEQYMMSSPPAACWLMPKALIKKIGGFNPLFFHYGEDDNYHDRILYHKIKTIVVPSALMFHDREEHGNIKVFNKKRHRRLMLVSACNINNSFASCILQWFRILVRCYTQDLPIKAYCPGSFFLSALWILYHTPIIVKSRRKEKHLALNWL